MTQFIYKCKKCGKSFDSHSVYTNVGAFLLGLLAGVFFFSRLADFIDRIADKKKPVQITFAYQSGSYEQQLFRFEDKYYQLSDYQILSNLHKQKIKKVWGQQ